ncbi:hypothetical protein [Mycobacterium sp.]|uniref:hypothetical protein n=1 Tax=Mycobacterium sp. TaxID=1785 RepID=UPI003D11BEAC
MLATFGLARLEVGLEEDTVTATDVAEFLTQAEPIDMRTLAREGMPEALDCMHRRIGLGADEARYLPNRDDPPTDQSVLAAIVSGAHQDGRSGPRYQHSQSNRQFGPRHHANRV